MKILAAALGGDTHIMANTANIYHIDTHRHINVMLKGRNGWCHQACRVIKIYRVVSKSILNEMRLIEVAVIVLNDTNYKR